MKTILVPTDFSSYSKNAIRLAGYMARVKGMQIKLLHILEEPNSYMGHIPFLKSSNIEYMSELEQSISDHMKEIIVSKDLQGVIVSHEVKRSKKGIIRELLDEKCDLIIMGRKRDEHNSIFFFGTNAEKIVRVSDVPVITVGELREDFSFRNIVFASDFEEEEQKPIVKRALDLADIFKAKINFLSVALNREIINGETKKETIENNASKFDLRGNDIELYVADTPEEGINQFVQDSRADLLALCTHGRKGIASFLMRSIAENMVAFASIPVLTYNLNKKNIDRVLRPVTREKIILRNKTGKKDSA